ncbi:hypothetical protein ACIPSE_46000 [Streptomyces sp. NPDC090106]|uniref:hypothetical protein n=1 Tax=Streptomyces sp. NPDC090106 TaxID=3365946 RepID=UPI0037F5466D
MEFRRRGLVIVAVAVTVFAWSLMMTMAGHLEAVVTLAPALGVTVQQIVVALRPQPQTGAGTGRVEEVAGREEDGAP